MGNTFGTLIGAATLGLGTLGVTLANQDPVASAATPDKRVSASMNNASMDDVLEWLRRTGVNFVIEAGDPASRARLNINVNNQPLKDVMDSIANAVGGEWKKNGNVYSLRSGHGFAIPPMAPGELRLFGGGEEGEWGELPPKIRERLEGLEVPEGWQRFEEMAPLIEKQFGEMGPEFEKRMHELMPKLEELKGLELEGGMHFKMFDDESVDKLLKGLTSKQKELMKSRGHLTPGDLTKDQEALLEKMGGLHGNITLHKDGEKFKIIGPGGDKVHGEVVIAPGTPMAPGMEMMPPVQIEPGAPAPTPLQHSRWKELRASLSASQKDLLKKQGHLWDDQLTAAQRRMISLPSDSNYTLTMTDGNESITIKSRKQ
jgi:hypothetical protein